MCIIASHGGSITVQFTSRHHLRSEFYPSFISFPGTFSLPPPKASSYGLNSTAFFENSYILDPLNPNTAIGLWETLRVLFAITTLGDTPRCAVTTEDKMKNIFLTSVWTCVEFTFAIHLPMVLIFGASGLSYKNIYGNQLAGLLPLVCNEFMFLRVCFLLFPDQRQPLRA